MPLIWSTSLVYAMVSIIIYESTFYKKLFTDFNQSGSSSFIEKGEPTRVRVRVGEKRIIIHSMEEYTERNCSLFFDSKILFRKY